MWQNKVVATSSERKCSDEPWYHGRNLPELGFAMRWEAIEWY
jgi:hypothetical protein